MRTQFRNVMIATLSLVCAAGLRAANLTWNVGDGTWDTTTANWTGDSTTFTDGGVDNVTFNNTSGGLITLNANHNPAGVVVSAASGTYTFTNNSITGVGKLTKSGAGKLELRAANTFTGGIDMVSGEIDVDDCNRLGGYPYGAGVNMIHFTGGATVTVHTDGTGGYTYDPITIDGGVTATLGRVSAAGNPYPGFYGNISGDGALMITGLAGNYLRIGASNSFKGNLILTGNGGFSDNTNLGDPTNTVVLENGGRFYNLAGGVAYSLSHTLQINGSSGWILSGLGCTWNGLVKGVGLAVGGSVGYPLVLANTNNSFVGQIYINTGELEFSAPGCLNGNSIYIDNGTLSALRIAGPSAVYTNSVYLYGGTYMGVTNANAVIDWNGALTGGGSAPGMRKTGAGTLNLNNAPAFPSGWAVMAGRLNVNFITASLPGITVSNGAAYGGYGTNNLQAGAVISGDGSIDPGTSVGIMTAPMVEAVTNGTLDFNFEFGQVGSPNYANASASGNDVLRLTNSTPFNGHALTSANVINVYLPGNLPIGTSLLRGGFYTDMGDFFSSYSGATFRYYAQKVGGPFTYGGQQYDWMTNVYHTTMLSVANVNEAGTQFGGVDGYVTQLSFTIPVGMFIQLH